jgi:hypothetical protein
MSSANAARASAGRPASMRARILVLRAKYIWLCSGLVSRRWTCGVNTEKLTRRVLFAAFPLIAKAVGIAAMLAM